MSIYIPGMEMPTGCCGCPIDSDSCKRWVKVPVGKLREERPKDCPLVPVPEHGRLVDADALIDKVIAKYLKFEREGKLVFAAAEIKQDIVDLISDAPTIIPASGGTDNE